MWSIALLQTLLIYPPFCIKHDCGAFISSYTIEVPIFAVFYTLWKCQWEACNKRKNDFAHSDTRGEELLQKAKQLLRRKRGQKESSFSDTISNLDFKPPLSFNYGKTDPIKRFLLYLGRQVWSWFVLLYLCEAVDYIWHGIWFGYIVAVPNLYLLREISFLFRSRQSWWMSTIPY